MALTFLCPTHREWVYFNPNEAITCIEDAQEKGELLIQDQKWQDAVAFLGCAFETTEILMEMQGTVSSYLLTKVTSLSLLLAGAFENLDAKNHARLILKQAENALHEAANNCLGNKPVLARIQQCIMSVRTNHGLFLFTPPKIQLALSTQLH